jgi:hypothetical protein
MVFVGWDPTLRLESFPSNEGLVLALVLALGDRKGEMVSGTFSCRTSLTVPARDGCNEGLVLALVLALGDRERLPVRRGLERRRADVRHPDLDRAQTLPAQPVTVRSDLVPRGSGRGCHRRDLQTPGVTDRSTTGIIHRSRRDASHSTGGAQGCDRSDASGDCGCRSVGCAAKLAGRGRKGGLVGKSGRRGDRGAKTAGCATEFGSRSDSAMRFGFFLLAGHATPYNGQQ